MIVVMSVSAVEQDIQQVVSAIEARGLSALRMPGGDRIAIGIPSAIPPDLREPLFQALSVLPGVQHVAHVSRPYKLASREFHGADTIVDVKGVRFGGRQIQMITGPCSVESYDQMRAAAMAARAAGATVLRGGAFKPRTSPYAFQGLQEEGLKILQRVGRENGLVTISEVMQPDLVALVAGHVDILQIGARNMQNFPLLIEAGKSGHPVMLKRGPSATLDEFLLAAEYLLHHNNSKVLLCERGVHPLDRSYTRNTLDLNAVPVLKEISHLPVIADPSHGTGISRYVPAMALAAVAAGADGIMVEMHPNPREALSDGAQSLTPGQLQSLMSRLRAVAAAVGRSA
ncbi:MAG: 3-deoxy-7-phosphoheptulonate synthase [Acidobacteria bacterium]|nr:3-deoxy-7-phosphoheptulonate synthase [Acidobacteriota bacterium]MCI0620267.1 3-deoxy-7-phosphoheptulonate synthase [Acidobacteriota bacterium]MCI0722971.1 3-deoxy-7-phosphoheptulonate synthase [Acidobacteriota bacterium]